MTIRYRYVDVVTEDGVILDLLTFRELKKTPAGAWVQGFYGGHYIGRKRFVLDGTGRRHCHQSKEIAWESYKHRKRMQRTKAIDSLNKSDFALEQINLISSPPPESVNLGKPDYWHNYIFD